MCIFRPIYVKFDGEVSCNEIILIIEIFPKLKKNMSHSLDTKLKILLCVKSLELSLTGYGMVFMYEG